MMRITETNVQSLVEALETLEELQDMKDYMEGWIEGRQEEPKTAEVRETLRENREAFEDRLDELADALQAALLILRPPAKVTVG
jgi:acyl transferase domain-containing protein